MSNGLIERQMLEPSGRQERPLLKDSPAGLFSRPVAAFPDLTVAKVTVRFTEILDKVWSPTGVAVCER